MRVGNWVRALAVGMVMVGVGCKGSGGGGGAKTEVAAVRVPAVLFDEWVASEGLEKRVVVGEWKSPSGRVLISEFKMDEDLDLILLVGTEVGSGKEMVLGYGHRGVKVTWFETRDGEVAVVENPWDNGASDLYVAGAPGMEGKGWSLLYRTPRVFGGLGVAHLYWKVLGLDGEMGVLRIRGDWDFSNVTNGERKRMRTGGEFVVPLFFGGRVEEAGLEGR